MAHSFPDYWPEMTAKNKLITDEQMMQYRVDVDSAKALIDHLVRWVYEVKDKLPSFGPVDDKKLLQEARLLDWTLNQPMHPIFRRLCANKLAWAKEEINWVLEEFERSQDWIWEKSIPFFDDIGDRPEN